jgi:hypothetical protein
MIGYLNYVLLATVVVAMPAVAGRRDGYVHTGWSTISAGRPDCVSYPNSDPCVRQRKHDGDRPPPPPKPASPPPRSNNGDSQRPRDRDRR